MRYKETEHRSQLTLFNNLEDLISSNNPVRLIDALLDQLNKKDPVQFNNGKGKKEKGRKS